MTTGTPYGPNISLDGLHPSAAGHTIIANAAARAIDDRYNVGLVGAVIWNLDFAVAESVRTGSGSRQGQGVSDKAPCLLLV
jgi:hypothetical protein